MFDIWSEYWNHACVLGLSNNLSHILQNVYNLVDITLGGHSCECIIFAQLIIIDLRIITNLRCGGDSICKYTWVGEEVIEVIEWSIFIILTLF